MNRDRTIVVVAGDDLRPDDDPSVGDRTQWHSGAEFIANVDLPQRGDISAVRPFALDVDLPDASEQVEVVDVDAAHCRLQGAEHIVHAEAQRLRLLAVDVEIDRRIVRRVGRENSGQPRVLVGGREEPLHNAVHRRRLLPLEPFELVFEPSGGRQPDDRRKVERDDGRRADLLSLAEHPRDQRLRRIRRPPTIGERLQRRNHEGRIRLVDAVDDREADDCENVLGLRHRS